MNSPNGALLSADAIAEPLLGVLRARFGPGIGYASPPRLLADGVTARAFALRLLGVAPELAGELVCRLAFSEPSDASADQFPVEEALHNALAQHGYPVPRVLASCGANNPLGAPFMLMERVAGRDLFGVVALGLIAGITLGLVLSWLPLALLLCAYWVFMVRLFARLHAIPGDRVLEQLARAGISPDRLSPDRTIDALQAQARAAGASELAPLIDWLRANRPEPSDPPTVCHGDFWLGNIIVGKRGASVLDWTQAGIAHPELDLGWVAIQHYSRLPIDWSSSDWSSADGSIADRIYDAAAALLSPFAWMMLGANGFVYRLTHRVDRSRLRYYTAFSCCKLLVSMAALRASAGPDQARPPLLIAWGSPRTVRLLYRRIRRITGLDLDPKRTTRPPAG